MMTSGAALSTIGGLILGAVVVALVVALIRERRRAAALEGRLAAADARLRNDELTLDQMSETDRLKDEFVSTVSHELRTPLTSIRGSLGLLSAGLLGTVDPKAQNLLRIALTNTDRLIRLINDILDLQRMESGRATLQLRRCSATDLAEQAVETMSAMAEGVGVKLEVEPLSESAKRQVYFDADPDRILQVLTNLLSNAIKFSPPQSTVRVEIATPRNWLEFRVVDQGRGVPEEQLETIFERFRQVEVSDARKKGGTGLGLPICRTIIQQHGGTVWAARNADKGMSLCVRMPRQQRISDLGATPTDEGMKVGDGTVLICHGNAALRGVIAEQLRGRGHTVLEAQTSGEAVALTAAQPTDQPVQAILLDIDMPDMNGWATLKLLTKSPVTAEIPLVILSVLPPGEGRKLQEKSLLRRQLRREPRPVEHEDRRFADLGPALASGARPGKVLLVEDDQDLASVVIAGFEKTDVRIEHASTRQQAMVLIQEEKPDLMILDLTLPDGDGFSLVDWLREHQELKALPLVVYSGREVGPEERVKLRLGPTSFLTKAKVQTQDVEELVLAMMHRKLLRRATDGLADGLAFGVAGQGNADSGEIAGNLIQ